MTLSLFYSRHLFLSPILLFLFLPHVLLSSTFAQSTCVAPQLTHERCNTTADCSQSLTPAECFGRLLPSGPLLNCTADPSIPFCRCTPIDTHYCDDNRDCLDEEYCGRSLRSGNQLCVGCNTLTDPFQYRGFEPVHLSHTLFHRCFQQGHKHPPCGYGDDLCSPSMPCDGDEYECVNTVAGRFFDCTWESTRCTCVKRGTVGDGKTEEDAVLRKQCAVDDQCEDREICALFTTHNVQFCVSCDYARVAHDVIPKAFSMSSRCDIPSFIQRPEPTSYIEGPNGRTLDRCLDDAQCTGSRECVSEEDKLSKNGRRVIGKTYEKCKNKKGKLCFCRPRNGELLECNTGSDCPTGETCVSLLPQNPNEDTDPLFGIGQHCTSNALLDVLSNRRYVVVGNRTRTPMFTGKMLTGDACRFDWDCLQNPRIPRRCTHVSDSYGGCAGRSNCMCKPLTSPSCESNNDCESPGEICTVAVDASFEPTCMSKQFVTDSKLYFPIGDVRLQSAIVPEPLDIYSIGLSEDRCLTTSDCKPPRRCVHTLDIATALADMTRCDARDGQIRNCVCRLNREEIISAGFNCSHSSDCVENDEICTLVKDQVPGGHRERRCMSRMAFDSAKRDGMMPTMVEFGVRQSPSPRRTRSPDEEDMETPMPSTPNSDGDESEVCVDVDLLKEFEASELVYEHHRRASVLCDTAGSCATPGHMVVYNGVAMSMRRYCETEGGEVHGKLCVRRTMWVNSPRMNLGVNQRRRRGSVRVKSKTNGLEMTALAARYETKVEEIILRQLIRLGA